jgi:hypothetical membrane protein
MRPLKPAPPIDSLPWRNCRLRPNSVCRASINVTVAPVAKEKCKRSNTQSIAAPAGAGVGLVLGLLVARWFGGRRVPRVNGVGPATNGSARIATISRAIVNVCAAYYVIVGVALHILEPEYDPRFRFMSEYVWGAYGWLMTTTFFVLGLAAFAVAAGLRDVHQSSRSARIGFGLLTVGALFVCLAGVFKEFIPHAAASAVAIPSIVMAALLLSLSFRQARRWQTIYRPLLLIASECWPRSCRWWPILGSHAEFLEDPARIAAPAAIRYQQPVSCLCVCF